MPKQRLLFLVALLAGTLLLACEAVSGVLTPTPTYTPFPGVTAAPGATVPPPVATPMPPTLTPATLKPSPAPSATFYADQDQGGLATRRMLSRRERNP